jgi:hypothetical protein
METQKIVKLLLIQPGIDFNKDNNDGWTPIYAASSKGHIEIVKLLLVQPKIDFNKADNNSWTPIYAASSKGHQAIVDILNEYQTNPTKTQQKLIRELYPIEEYFILFVLVTDDYFTYTSHDQFFRIIISLPQELQSVIAHRICRSSGITPRHKFTHQAIKKYLIK